MGVVDAQTFILGEPVVALRDARWPRCRIPNTRSDAPAGPTRCCWRSGRSTSGAGDEVITTPFTFFATAGTIHNVGAKPVFVDIDPVTFNIDPSKIGAAITSNDESGDSGRPLRADGARSSRSRSALAGLPMIEDAAQSIGARRSIDGEWRMAGEVGDDRHLQFLPVEEPGRLRRRWNDGHAGRRGCTRGCVRLRTHGGVKTYFHEEVGFNSRLDALQAAVLDAKLPHLAAWSAEAASARRVLLRGVRRTGRDVRTPVVGPENESIFNQYTIRAARRDALQSHLKNAGDRHGDLLSAAAASAALLRVPRLPAGQLPGVGTGRRMKCCRCPCIRS